jgi:cation diffusion facilitator family transporter
MTSPDRASAVRRVLWIVLFFNLAITITKLVVGLKSGALAVVADAFHSLVDTSSNIVGLVGVWVAARPADQNHPYGHHKYETIATLSIGALLLVAAFEIGRTVLQRLLGAYVQPVITPPVIVVMTTTLGVNLGLSVYEARAGRRHNSSLLRADAVHTRTDLYVTLSVILSLLGARLGLAWLDSVVAAAVALLLFRAAFVILRSSSQELSDVAVADPAAVEDAALAVPGVSEVSSVRSRGTGDAKYIDLHIKVNPAMDADQAHGVASEVERRIAAALPGVVDTVVHVEPGRLDGMGSDWEALALKLRGVADGMGLSLHDLHAHLERDGGVAVEVHLELAANLTLHQAHALADRFEARAREILPKLRSLVTHLEPLPTSLDDEASRLSPAGLAALRKRLTAIADELAGPGACHNVELHDLSGHLTATLHVTQPADMPLTQAHALAEAIERQLHASVDDLNRVVVHVEPPLADRI